MSWHHEDGGPQRLQTTPGTLGARGRRLLVTTRAAPVTTMVVGNVEHTYLLRHGAGERAVSFVERIDPVTLEMLGRSPDLPGGAVWPGGLGIADDDGAIHVVFGNHCHRLGPDLRVQASQQLPRDRPYNGFVPLPDGHLVTKDFGGSRPGHPVPAADREPAELVVLEPLGLRIVDRLVLPEPSIARLSAVDTTVYAVGDTSLLRVRWDGGRLELDSKFAPRYRTLEGQTYGWDCVLADGTAWLLDDGEGTETYSGTLRGHGVSRCPLHLVRIDLGSGDVELATVGKGLGGLVANPPIVDVERRIAVGYDSGNGVMTAFDIDTLEQRWRRRQDHGGHLLLYADSGELVTGDGPDVVILDIVTGEELARADAGHGIQSVLFPAPGANHEFYVCSFLGVSRVAVAS